MFVFLKKHVFMKCPAQHTCMTDLNMLEADPEVKVFLKDRHVDCVRVDGASDEGPSGPRREKTCLLWFANNKGADQPAHPRSLINAFVIRFLESNICKLATGKI